MKFKNIEFFLQIVYETPKFSCEEDKKIIFFKYKISDSNS